MHKAPVAVSQQLDKFSRVVESGADTLRKALARGIRYPPVRKLVKRLSIITVAAVLSVLLVQATPATSAPSPFHAEGSQGLPPR